MAPPMSLDGPGSIRIVLFTSSGSGSAYAFDYRERLPGADPSENESAPMRPPFCAICFVSFRDSGFEYEAFTLVRFRPTRTYPQDWDGHPEHCEWFCPSHLHLTEGLTHLPAAEALTHIRTNLREMPHEGTPGAFHEADPSGLGPTG